MHLKLSAEATLSVQMGYETTTRGKNMKIRGILFFLSAILILSTGVWAIEMALTKSGKKVVLKNDGTWEVYNPQIHLNVSDIREEAPQIQLFIKYYDYQFYRDNQKLWWEGNGLSPDEIKDSLKALPQGGVVEIRIESDAVDSQDPKTYMIKVKDHKQREVWSGEALDIQAVDSPDAGLLILKKIPLKKKYPKEVWVYITEKAMGQEYQFNIPIK